MNVLDEDRRLIRAARGADPRLIVAIASPLVSIARAHESGHRSWAVDVYRERVMSLPGGHGAAQALVRLARLEGQVRLARALSKIARRAARPS